MQGTLYIVATPIGNLEDITLRAIRIIGEVDIVLAEDTRVTKKLIDFVFTHNSLPASHHPQLKSYHQHSNEERKLEILKYLMDGKNIALVTDAGTPGISDPGNELIDYLLSYQPELKVVPIPGASAITTALSVSGIEANKFLFLGFWPKKKAGKLVNMIKLLSKDVHTIVFYESPYRILKSLSLLEKEFGASLKIVVARELTKMHETLYRGDIQKVKSALSGGKIKGEIVVVLQFEIS